MRQLLARIDDDLHRRLKRRAAAEGRSLNAMVNEILRDAVARKSGPDLLRARLKALGRLADIPRPRKALSRNAAIALTRGAGDAVSRALAEDRRRQ